MANGITEIGQKVGKALEQGGAAGASKFTDMLSDIGNQAAELFTSPEGKKLLYGVGAGLDPQGVGGMLAQIGMGMMESEGAAKALTAGGAEMKEPVMTPAVGAAVGPAVGSIGTMPTLDDLVNQVLGE